MIIVEIYYYLFADIKQINKRLEALGILQTDIVDVKDSVKEVKEALEDIKDMQDIDALTVRRHAKDLAKLKRLINNNN